MDPINPVAGNPEAVNPQPEIPQAPKDPHGITIAALAGFILLSLAAVAFLYYQNQQLKTMLASYQSTPTPFPETPLADPTANWKTYTNTKYGYSVKYPTDWTAKSIEPGPPDLPLNATSRGLAIFPSIYNSSATSKALVSLETDGPENTAFKNYNDWLLSVEKPFFTVTSKSQTTFAGLPSETITGTYDGYGFPANMKLIAFKSSDGKTYYTVTTTIENNSSETVTINLIISTFKFITPTSSPSASPVACTQEAKLCPNGTSVGRTGPNCEFAPCPTP